MYAVVRTGGKQYRVEEGRAITIERLPGEAGQTVELSDVLLLADGDAITVGAPNIAGARVVGRIAEQGRSPKIIVYRYKNKTRARKKNGHRQQFTKLLVEDILTAGQQPKPKQEVTPAVEEAPAEVVAPKGRRARKVTPEATAPEAVEPMTAAAEATAPETVEPANAAVADATPSDDAPAPVDEAPKPKRTRKKAE